MQTRRLGRTPLDVPVLGFGAATLGETPLNADLIAATRERLAAVQDVEWPVGLPENAPPVLAR